MENRFVETLDDVGLLVGGGGEQDLDMDAEKNL